MVDFEKVLEVAKYIITENATNDDVCKKFNISRKTAQVYTNEYLRELSSHDPSLRQLYDQVQIIKSNNEKKSSKNIDMVLVIEDMTKNKLTKEFAANKYGISVSSISKYLQSLEENNPLLIAYKESRKAVINYSNKVGGLNSKRDASINEFEAREIAETMVEEGLTVKKASDKFERPKSTIYEAIRRIDDDEVQQDLDNLFEQTRIIK